MNWNEKATASVIPARYGPRRRVAGSPTTNPAAAPASTEIARTATTGVVRWWADQIAVAKAPTPMNAPLPIDTWPEYPVRKDNPRMTIAADAAPASWKFESSGRW